MSLPKFHDNNRTFQMLQNTWAAQLNPVLANPLTNGIILNNVELINGTTVVNHRLGRKLQGWLVIGLDAAATIFDNQASNQMPELTLSLTSDAACTCTLYVF